MATTNYNLPTISGNMTADVVRDMNALAQATDNALSGVSGEKVSTTDFTAHLTSDTPHQFSDGTTIYKYGFKTNQEKDGLIFVYEEVV